MTKEFLTMLREETKKEVLKLKAQNKYTEGQEESIIISIYNSHMGQIDEEDTNHIYYYDGTYKYVYDCSLEAYDLGPIKETVSRDDPEAEFRRYANVEGVYTYEPWLSEADGFEKNHTILYDEGAINDGMSPYWITNDFVIMAVKENQEAAKKLILTKYKTNRK